MALTKEDFARALEFGDMEGLRAGVEAGWGAGAIFPEAGGTALMMACHSGWDEGVKALLPISAENGI